MKFLFLAIVVALLLLPVPAPAPSGSVFLNIDVDWMGWEAYFTEGSDYLSNDYSAARLAISSDQLGINDAMLDEGLAWHDFVPLWKRSFFPIPALCSEFYLWNINYMPAVKFFACLDLEQNSSISNRHYLRRFDWHRHRFEKIEDTFGLYANNPLMHTQTYDERFGSALSSIEYLAFDLGHSIAEWDYFTYDFDSFPIENAVPMPANILLICLGLIGLVGFARKMTTA